MADVTQDLANTRRGVKTDINRHNFESKLQNLVPRIGWIVNSPILSKGNTFFDVQTNTLYFSNGTNWIPVANAASFMTSTDTNCAPDTVVVIEPSTYISGTNIGVALVPRGTGGITLSAPDNAITGGNCRGNYAVDMQMQRTAATQIASGISSNISGGEDNEASGNYSNVCGGLANTSSANYSFIGGGQLNTSSGLHSTIPGGIANTSSGTASLAAGQLAIVSHANSMCFSCDTVSHATTVTNEFKVGLKATSGRMTIDNLIAFDDDAAAGVGGLTTGMVYQTTGSGAAPLNAPGIVMIKQ